MADLVEQLESAAIRLTDLVANHEVEAWNVAGPDNWSALDVLAHVRSANEILMPRITQILIRDNPPMPAFDERDWATANDYVNQPLKQLAARVVDRCVEFGQLLSTLSPDQWQRTGLHEQSGELTLLQIATHTVAHIDEHVAQIAELLGAI